MKFNHNGDSFEIEFLREHKQVRVGYDPKLNIDLFKPSLRPYTTVKLWRTKPDCLPELYRSATVGAWHKEAFTLEKGRIHALRALTPTLSKGTRSAVWGAYMARNKAK